jgi:hypothetical protein
MWLDKLKPGDSWMGIWTNKFTCGKCLGIIEISDSLICPICKNDNRGKEITFLLKDGTETTVPTATLMGPLDYTSYSILELMRLEWERPVSSHNDRAESAYKIPERLLIVILFWSLFENLMDVFFTKALRKIPPNISDDLLSRYGTIGSRMDRLYKLLFSITLKDDLISIGKEKISEHLKQLQNKRNEFIHGKPYAIDEKLINETLSELQETQGAWIQLYNKRCTFF